MSIRDYQEPLIVVDTDGMPNDEWLDYRRQGIGGSDAGIVMNTSPWATPLGLYHDKVGTEPLIKDESGKNFIFAYGHFMEPFVAEYFYDNFEKYKPWLEEKIGKKIDHIKVYRDTNLYRHPEYEFMQLNLDFRIDIVTSDGGFLRGVFECKTTSQFNADKWQGEDYPINYGWQCRHAMAVIDADFSILACVAGNTEGFYFVKFIKRDKAREALLIEEEQKFWERVINREPPTTENMDVSETGAALIEDLKKYVNAAAESKITLYDSEENSEPFKKYFKLKDEMKELKKKIEVEEGIIREKLGKNQSAVLELDDYIYSVSARKSTRRSLDTARLRKERPDIVDAYNRTTISNTVKISRRVNKTNNGGKK